MNPYRKYCFWSWEILESSPLHVLILSWKKNVRMQMEDYSLISSMKPPSRMNMSTTMLFCVNTALCPYNSRSGGLTGATDDQRPSEFSTLDII